MTGVDKDLATWRQVTEQGERAMTELVWTMLNVNWRASADRVEAELARLRDENEENYVAFMNEREKAVNADAVAARLREERDDALQAHAACGESLIECSDKREAAEARLLDALSAENEANLRCARLQQALTEIAAFDSIGGTGLGFRQIAREALAGPDTPADSRSSGWVCDREDCQGGPADSQEDKT